MTMKCFADYEWEFTEEYFNLTRVGLLRLGSDDLRSDFHLASSLFLSLFCVVFPSVTMRNVKCSEINTS